MLLYPNEDYGCCSSMCRQSVWHRLCALHFCCYLAHLLHGAFATLVYNRLFWNLPSQKSYQNRRSRLKSTFGVVVRWPRISQTVAEVYRLSTEFCVSPGRAAGLMKREFCCCSPVLDICRAALAAMLRVCCMVLLSVSSIIASFEIYPRKNSIKIVGRA